MIIWEYLIQFTFVLCLFYGSLEIQSFILTKTREHGNSFRALTQSTFSTKRPSILSFRTKKTQLYKKALPLAPFSITTLQLEKATYHKKGSNKKRPLPKILTERGEIHLFSSMLFFLLIMTTMMVLYREFRHTRLMIERKNDYLCLKSVLEKNYRYTKEMGRLNGLIAINYPLQFNPKTGPVHKQIITVAKTTQSALTVKFYYELKAHLTPCSIWQKLALRHLSHYQFSLLSFSFKRDPLERALTRKEKIEVTLPSSSITSDAFKLTFSPPHLHHPLKTSVTPLFWSVP